MAEGTEEGLKVVKSTVRRSWEEERIWLSLVKLGLAGKVGAESCEFKTSDEDDIVINLRNDWLSHMCLSPDLLSERDGVQVRAMQGLRGVDFLEGNPVAKAQTYVFGPLIHTLKTRGGYKEGHDLCAAPYDWRVTPLVLEERDRYFTRTLDQIEQMKLVSGRAVVLLCHSMGARAGDYLLRFALKQKGRAWIDQHVHTFMPVGGPLLGAASSLSSVLCGSKMGLPDSFLSDHGALLLARSLGSTPWLLPTDAEGKVGANPRRESVCFPFVMKQGMIELKVESLDIRTLRQRYSELGLIRIGLRFQGQMLKTPWVMPSPDSSISLDEVFEFPTVEKWIALEQVEIVLYEQGLAMQKNRRTVSVCRCGSCYDCCCSVLCCPCCCVIHASEYVLNESYYASKEATNQALTATDAGVKIRQGSLPVGAVSKSERVDVKLNSTANYSSRHRRGGSACTLRIDWRWKSHQEIVQEERLGAPLEGSDKGQTSSSFVTEVNETHPALLPISPSNLMTIENLESLRNLWTGKHYQDNPLISTTAPPVKRVYALYGVNVDTEVSGVYKRVPRRVAKDKLQVRYTLHRGTGKDIDSALLKKYGLVWRKDKLFETSASSQPQPSREPISRSGDGTVALKSLQAVQTWRDTCEVTVKELDGVLHRDIVAHPDFHRLVLEYCTNTAPNAGAGDRQNAITSQ